MSIERKISKVEQKLLLTPIKAYINAKYNIVVERNDTIGLKPPYLIVGNHVTDWDPLFINCYVEEPISFVAAASAFRKPFMKKVLNYAGAIPKTKSRTDTSTIRNILKAKKANRVIGLFPEGNRNWNGLPEPIFYSTVKLMKSLNIPIIVVNIKGGYLSSPRWAMEPRKGKVSLTFRKVWDIGDLKEMTHDEIFEQLQKELYVDDFKWNENERISFKGRNLAEGIERYLYMCPSCQHLTTIRSEGDYVSCNQCHYKVKYNEYGLFEQMNKPLHFKYIYEWSNWQSETLLNLMKNKETHEQLLKCFKEQVHVTKSLKDGTFVDHGVFTMTIENQVIHLTSENGEVSIQLPILELDGVNLFKQLVLNFFFEEQHYHIELKNDHGPSYMWLQYIILMQKNANPERDLEF